MRGILYTTNKSKYFYNTIDFLKHKGYNIFNVLKGDNDYGRNNKRYYHYGCVKN